MKIDTKSALARLIAAQNDVHHHKPTSFWAQCVRDASGSWKRYEGLTSNFGTLYFRGFQPNVDYHKPGEVFYLVRSMATRQRFYETLPAIADTDLAGFTAWLVDLRRTLDYRPADQWLHVTFVTSAHSVIVREKVMRVAQEYHDTYATGETRGPVFDGMPETALPFDVTQDGLVEHHYPTLNFSEEYLSAAHRELRQLLTQEMGARDYIYGVANFFQLLSNLHYFAVINAGLYMNMANGLLEVAGIDGIEHGVIDFVALRLQPASFRKYYYDQVTAAKYLL